MRMRLATGKAQLSRFGTFWMSSIQLLKEKHFVTKVSKLDDLQQSLGAIFGRQERGVLSPDDDRRATQKGRRKHSPQNVMSVHLTTTDYCLGRL